MDIKKLYDWFNIILIVIFVVIFILGFFDIPYKYELGIVDRTLISIISIINGVWITFTKYETLLINKGNEDKRTLLGIILLVVGVLGLITVFMGYGFNNVYPDNKQ